MARASSVADGLMAMAAAALPIMLAGLLFGAAPAGAAAGEPHPPAPPQAQRAADLVPELSAAEIERVLSHGPWPPSRVHGRVDQSNRASGNPAAIRLGKRLFADAGLSGDGTLACSSCHDPARGFIDGLPRGRAAGVLDRNTPALHDLGGRRWYGWDGGADSLWAATLRPLFDAREMAASPQQVAARIRGTPALARSYGAAFGAPSDDDERVAVDAAKAIAAWLETLRSGRTAFDDFRDALARGDARAAAAYPAAARRGLAIFVGRGNCSTCHFGAAFTNGEFHDIGIPFMPAAGRVDPGRHAGIRRLLADRYNLLGPHNDAPAGPGPADPALKTRTVALMHRNWGEWKVPSLRGVAATAPYMHDGRLATLHDVVRHYSELDEERLHADGEAILKPLRLSPQQQDDLVAFLRTLGPRGADPPLRTAAPPRTSR